MPDDGLTCLHERLCQHGGSREAVDYFSESNGIRYAGKHLLVDFWGANLLTDPDAIGKALRTAAEAAHATILHGYFHRFGDGGGVSGILVLAESHISIHTWPERELAAIDIFMCGSCDPHKALERLRQIFTPSAIEMTEHKRGQLS